MITAAFESLPPRAGGEKGVNFALEARADPARVCRVIGLHAVACVWMYKHGQPGPKLVKKRHCGCSLGIFHVCFEHWFRVTENRAINNVKDTDALLAECFVRNLHLVDRRVIEVDMNVTISRSMWERRKVCLQLRNVGGLEHFLLSLGIHVGF